MKFLLLPSLLILNTFLFSQVDNQFDGVQNFTGTIFRSGSVGIGTNSSPLGQLHVYGDFILSRNNGGFVFTQGYEQGDHFLAIAPNASGSYATDWQWNKGLNFNGLTGQLTKFVENSTDVAFAVSSDLNTNFKVLGNGNVVIGNVTTPNGYKLYVADGILTEKVKIALRTSSQHWSDFVFDDDYKLRSLKSVENFIKDHKHLPDMPSGEELFKSGGVDVFEMLKLQQQKIEELTLYIIELNKRIKRTRS